MLSGIVVVAPCAALAVFDPVARVIEGGADTTSVTVVVCAVTPYPPLARMVIVLVPATAPLPAVRLSVDADVPFGSDAGEKDAVTSVGRFSADSVTGPVKPPPRVMVIGYVAVPPRATVAVVVLAATVWLACLLAAFHRRHRTR